MFELTNEIIKKYASLRAEDAYVMPMYVSLYNERYALDDLNSITSYSPNSIKVGFVSVQSILEKKPFSLLSPFEVTMIETVTDHDDSKGIDVNYIVFETGILNNNGPMYEQINYYVSQLDTYVKNIVNENKSKLRKEVLDYYS